LFRAYRSYWAEGGVLALGTVPAGQAVPDGFVPGGFCGVLLFAAFVFEPFADAVPAASVVAFTVSPGAFPPAALTHGAPVRFMLGLLAGAFGVAAFVELVGAAFVGVGVSCVGAGGVVVPSPAAFVVIGVGGPIVDDGVVVEFVGSVAVVGAVVVGTVDVEDCVGVAGAGLVGEAAG